jgi:histidine triad (HIT) family protein
MSDDSCLFCRIVSGKTEAVVVYQDEDSLAFLDHRPLFLGHTLLIPKKHIETLSDLPEIAVGPFFVSVQRISRAVQAAMGAEGTFVAMNNRVSQSVPHLHVHIVPRKKGDGLKGFFWPRTKYKTNDEMLEIGKVIAKEIK